MVFLAGLGNTAHIFDDFAPAFVDRHHVVAITGIVKAHFAGAHVVEYPRGHHYLFITQRAQVLAEMRTFDAALPR